MTHIKKLSTFLLFSLLISTFAQAESKLIWDHWYVITLNGKVPYGYYHEKTETKDGRYIMSINLWKQEEDFVNHESMGVYSKMDDVLTPLFFNFRSLYRSTELMIDGTVNEKNALSVRIKKGGQDLPVVMSRLPKNTFFSSMFPLWIGKQLSKLTVGKSVSFMTLKEDDAESQFKTESGLIRMEQPDEFSKKTKSKKISVTFYGQKSTWWVDDLGSPLRIDMKNGSSSTVRTTEKEAKSS